MRTHTGERPYSCNMCDKKLITKGHLVDHQRRHYGERPFKCQLCDSSFFRSTALKDHMKKHKNGEQITTVRNQVLPVVPKPVEEEKESESPKATQVQVKMKRKKKLKEKDGKRVKDVKLDDRNAYFNRANREESGTEEPTANFNQQQQQMGGDNPGF